MIYSTVKEIADQHQYFFETLWNKAIPVEHRIRELEKGIPYQQIDVVQDTQQALDLYKNLVRSATNEIMLLFPSVNAVVRQAKAGIMGLIAEAVAQPNIRVRMLLPDHELTRSATSGLANIKSVTTRFIEQEQGGKATILIVDSEECLMMELRDDSKTTFYEAIGLSTYSNSRAGVLSYVSIFESLWRQTELYEKIKEHEKIQGEFINIAAHELRTPVQPLLGLADIFMIDLEGGKQIIEVSKADGEMIIRNVKRLKRLTFDVLEASKIESNALKLNEELIDLNEKVRNVVEDEKRAIPKRKKLNIIFEQKEKSVLLVRADKLRLFRALSNIICNAIKFTDEGTITVSAEKKDGKRP